ncbi:hypothetical protein BYT27DRAFT_6377943 [Phlegmacium glaucopus]|nr:hypothetical protein BYT27DRAFT_6377943 [Phlegmacium glaucopus]
MLKPKPKTNILARNLVPRQLLVRLRQRLCCTGADRRKYLDVALFLRQYLIEGQLQHPKSLVTRKPEPHILIVTDSPRVTPKTRSSTRCTLRDSPDNPFLSTPENTSTTLLAQVIAAETLVHMHNCLFVVFNANAGIHCIIMLRTGCFPLLQK